MNGVDLNTKNFVAIKTIIQDLLAKSNTLTKENVSQCSDKVVINKKLLKNYTNSIHEFNDDYYLLSKDEITNSSIKYCKNVSDKYLRKLKLISCIKYIYDTENVGNNNISSLIQNHIIIDNEKKVLKLKSCKSKQKKWWWDEEEGLNLLLIPGLKCFIENILSKKEKTIFIEQLKTVFKSNDYTKLHKYVCKDDIIKSITYEKLYKTIFYCKSFKKGGGNKYLVNIEKYNPIISKNMCRSQIVYEYKYLLQFRQMVENMKSNYRKNILKVKNLLEVLVIKENDSFVFKKISSTMLYNIEKKIKRTIILFYMQSLMDYKNIFNTIRLYT